MVKHRKTWTKEMVALLGSKSDGAIAQQITEELGIEISTSAVQKKRRSLDIPAFPINYLEKRRGKPEHLRDNTLGDRVRNLRYRRGLTQKQLAAIVGCNSRSLWKIENDLLDSQSQFFQNLLIKIFNVLKECENGIKPQ